MKRNWREVGEGVCMALDDRGPVKHPPSPSSSLCVSWEASGLAIRSVCLGLQLSAQLSIFGAITHHPTG